MAFDASTSYASNMTEQAYSQLQELACMSEGPEFELVQEDALILIQKIIKSYKNKLKTSKKNLIYKFNLWKP